MVGLVTLSSGPEFRKGQGLGAAYLGASLVRADFDVEFLEVASGQSPSFQNAPSLIGVSVMFTAQLAGALEVIDELRPLYPEAHITIGGNGCSFIWDKILQSSLSLDSAACFEGDETIVALAKCVAAGAPPSQVAGLYVRTPSGVSFTGYREPPTDLDDLPFPLRDDRFLIDGDRHLAVLTSRGCSAHCTFCQSGNYGNRYHSAARWRARTPANILQELTHLSESYGVNNISFVDDDFLGACSMGEARCDDFTRLLARSRLDVNFSIECRAEEITEQRFQRLADVGLKHVFFGVESAVPAELKLYGKQETTDEFRRAIGLLRSLDMFFTVGFIMFQPNSSPDSLGHNLEFLANTQLLTTGRLTNKLQLYAGGPLTTYYQRHGPSMAESDFVWMYDFADSEVQDIYDRWTALAEVAQPREREIFEQIFQAQTSDRPSKATLDALAKHSGSLADIAMSALRRDKPLDDLLAEAATQFRSPVAQPR